jgi:hypothetical protein
MKIALCISGQSRMWEKGFEYHYENIIKDNDVTVFLHSWEMPAEEMQAISAKYNAHSFITSPNPTVDLSKYTNTPPSSPNWKVKDGRMSTYAQLYAINQCMRTKREYEEYHNIKFDCVVRSRFDFAINVRIPFEELDNNKLHIPNCRMTPSRDFGNDQFAFSSSDNMDKYADAYNHIDNFYNSGVQYMMEDFMSANWKLQGLTGDNLVYCDINHPFPPGEYNGTWHSLLRKDMEEWLK